MSKKQYKMFAAMIANAKSRFEGNGSAIAVVEYFEQKIADICNDSNDKFNYDKFRAACKKD